MAISHATTLLGSGIVGHGLYGSGLVAPGHYYGSGIVAPGLLNTVVAPRYAVRGAPLLSAGIPTAYTTKSVLSAAPLAYAASPVVAAPITYAARPVLSAPAAITSHRTVIGATSLLTGAPLVYNSGLVGAPHLLNAGLVSPIGLNKGSPYLGAGVVRTILK